MKVFVLFCVFDWGKNFITFAMSRFPIDLVAHYLILRMLYGPFKHLLKFFTIDDLACRIMWANNEIPFLTCFMGLFDSIHKSAYFDISSRKDDAWFYEIIVEGKIVRAVYTKFVAFFEKRTCYVLKTNCRTKWKQQIVNIRTMIAIKLDHLQNILWWRLLMSDFVHELFLDLVVFLWFLKCLNCALE